LRYLQERLLGRSHQVQVEVALSETPAEVTPLDLGPAAIEEWISAERAVLLAPLTPIRRQKTGTGPKQPVSLDRLREAATGVTPRELRDLKRRHAAGEVLTAEEQARREAGQALARAMAAMTGRAFSQPQRQEDRSRDEYVQEVESYLNSAREAAAQVAINVAIERELIRLQPSVTNHSDRNFPKVEVELYVAGHVMALDDELDIDEFPARPRLFGTPRPSPLSALAWSGLVAPPDLPRIPAARGIPEITIDNSSSASLRFRPVDLRPKRSEELAAFHLVVPADLAGQTLSIAWTATSSGADGQANGSLALGVGATPARLKELLAPMAG
jgi:hypothetical protein